MELRSIAHKAALQGVKLELEGHPIQPGDPSFIVLSYSYLGYKNTERSHPLKDWLPVSKP